MSMALYIVNCAGSCGLGPPRGAARRARIALGCSGRGSRDFPAPAVAIGLKQWLSPLLGQLDGSFVRGRRRGDGAGRIAALLRHFVWGDWSRWGLAGLLEW